MIMNAQGNSPAAKLILIVDDEPEIRELIASGFQSRGFRTAEADNGKNAYERFVSEQADAVVTDVRMPGGDGIELLTRVKTLRPEVPVFLVTGFCDLATDDALKLGAEALFSKPFSRLKLIEAVIEALRTK